MRNRSRSNRDSAVPLLLSQFGHRPAPGPSSQSVLLCSRSPGTLLLTMSSCTELSIISLVAVLAEFPVVYRTRCKCLSLTDKLLCHLVQLLQPPRSHPSPLASGLRNLSSLPGTGPPFYFTNHLTVMSFYRIRTLTVLLIPSFETQFRCQRLSGLPGASGPHGIWFKPLLEHLVFRVVLSPALS